MNERLYRSRDDRVISGVAGGVADYFGIDPAIVRIAWAVLILFSGGLLFLLYVIMWIVVPEEPYDWAAASGSPGPAAPPPAPGPTAPPGPAGEPVVEGAPAAGAAAFAEPATTSGLDPAAPAAEAAPTDEGANVEAAGAEPAGEAAPAQPAGAWVAPTATAWSPAPPPPPLDPAAARRAERAARRAERRANRDPSGAIVFGLILVLIGAFFLVQMYVPAIDAGRFWPIVLVVLGLVLLVAAVRPRSGPPPVA